MTCPSPNSPWKNARRIAWHEPPPVEPRVGSQVACAPDAPSSTRSSRQAFARFARDDPLSRHLADRRRRSDRGPRRKPRRRRDRRAGRGQPVFSGRKRPDAPRRCRHSNSSSSRGARPSTTLTKQSVFLARRETEKAAARYETRLDVPDEFWSDLVACRLTVAYDRTQASSTGPWWRLYARLRGSSFGASAAVQIIPGTCLRSNGGLWSGGWRTGGRPVRRCAAGSARLLELVGFDVLRKASDDRTAQAATRVGDASLAPSVRRRCTPSSRKPCAGRSPLTRIRPFSTPWLKPSARLRRIGRGFSAVEGDALSKNARTRDDLIRAAGPICAWSCTCPTTRAPPTACSARPKSEPIGRGRTGGGVVEGVRCQRRAPRSGSRRNNCLPAPATETRPKPDRSAALR